MRRNVPAVFSMHASARRVPQEPGPGDGQYSHQVPPAPPAPAAASGHGDDSSVIPAERGEREERERRERGASERAREREISVRSRQFSYGLHRSY
jgi:hypothetical protein